jgi:uncharacterized protein (TIGR03437 family)
MALLAAAAFTVAAGGEVRQTAPAGSMRPVAATAACGMPGGAVVDAMESVGDWRVMLGNGAVSGSLSSVPGCQGQAVQLAYNLGAQQGAWVQLRRDFAVPLDLSAGDHLRFVYRGTARNTIEIGLVSSDGQNYFASAWNEASGVPTCSYATWDLKDFLKDNQPVPDLSHVRAVFVSVVKSTPQSAGGAGVFLVDELQLVSVAGRETPSAFEALTVNPQAVEQAASWVGRQQQPSGLLKSWMEETANYSWLYDQALGLMVLSETDLARAHQLAGKIRSLQNADGYWFDGYDYATSAAISAEKPIGSNAWMVFALTRYFLKSRSVSAMQAAVSGAQWLATQQRANGSLSGSTEANLDAWWAFQTTGFPTQAARLRDFLLNQVWDGQMGRFKADADSRRIFLDNQTWGAALLRAAGRPQDALRALSYARWILNVTSTATPYGDVCGYDGAGPFGVWNEGTLQYVAMRGENSQTYWDAVAKQQAADGGVPGSPLANGLSAYIVWLTPWHGVAPASWFYLAAKGGPFPMPLASVSAASYYGPPLAVESIAAAFGQDLAGEALAAEELPLPVEIAGTELWVTDSQGTERAAPLFFVSPEQITFQVPPGAALGPAEIKVTRKALDSGQNGQIVAAFASGVEIEPVAPSVFAANGDGQGPAAAIVVRVKPDGSQTYELTACFSAAQNKFVSCQIDLGAASDQVFLSLYGTGIRFRDSLTDVTATVGGRAVEVLYAGAQGALVGLDQVNLRLPRELAGRGEVDISLSVNGRPANPVKVSIR